MDTISLLMAAIAGLVTVVLFIASNLYLKRTQAKVTENKPVISEETKASVETSDGPDVPEPTEAMQKCPFSFFEHIPGAVKKTEHDKIQKTIEENMTQTEREKEREVQRQQMQEIFRLMQGQEEAFGISDMNEMQEQMKMYTVAT